MCDSSSMIFFSECWANTMGDLIISNSMYYALEYLMMRLQHEGHLAHVHQSNVNAQWIHQFNSDFFFPTQNDKRAYCTCIKRKHINVWGYYTTINSLMDSQMKEKVGLINVGYVGFNKLWTITINFIRGRENISHLQAARSSRAS